MVGAPLCRLPSWGRQALDAADSPVAGSAAHAEVIGPGEHDRANGEMPRSGVAEEPFPSPCVSGLRVPACLLLARIDGRSPTSTDQWLLSSAVH